MKKLALSKVALVYDHLLTPYGGAELVLETLLTQYPQAELFTTIQDRQITTWHKQTKVHTTALQQYSDFIKKRELLDLFTPIALESYDFSQYQVVISVTSSAAKGIITTPKQLHVCYLLNPTRYLYQDKEKLLRSHSLLKLPILRRLASWVLQYLTWWDQAAIWRPDKVIAISEVVAERMKMYYHRQADAIVYPPITKPQLTQKATTRIPNSLLCIARLVPYKRIDLAIQAALQTDKKLLIVGTGSELSKLQVLAGSAGYTRTTESLQQALKRTQTAGKKIVFLGSCTEQEKAELFLTCSTFIMPGIEDFGLAALEAVSYGIPTIIAAESGVATVIRDGKEGIHYKSQSLGSLLDAIKRSDNTIFSSQKIQAYAEQFTREKFVRKLHNLVFAFYTEHSTINQ